MVMGVRHLWGFRGATLISCCLALCLAIPNSLVDEIKANELRDNKVKRAPAPNPNSEERTREPVPFFDKPTAIKRGASSANLKNPSPDQQSLSEWEQVRSLYRNPGINVPPSLFPGNDDDGGNNNYNDFRIGDDEDNEKSIDEYEKGFHYGTNKEKMDEAMENAVLKSELYGDPTTENQYRYFTEGLRRRRRNALRPRMKRQVDLTPEEFLTILTLYENEQNRRPIPYKLPQAWGATLEERGEQAAEHNNEDDEDNWMDTPTYPHASGQSPNDVGPVYDPQEERPGRWGGSPQRRFMVARKRGDPTRELRYLNGPSRNDFYTLNQLLSNPREPNVPLYRRQFL